MAQAVNPAINSLAAGEITPLLRGRTDLDWYKNSCQRARNIITLIEGGATRRPPTRFVAPVADSTNLAIVRPFVFSENQARIIEFGDQRMRFYADKAIIVDLAGFPLQIASSYLASELRTLKFVESADVLFIFHPRHHPAQLERFSDTDWKLVDMPFTDGPYLDVNANNAMTLTPSATAGAITLSASSSIATLTIPVWQTSGFPPVIIPLTVNGVTFSGDTVTLPAGTPALTTGQEVLMSGNLPDPLNDDPAGSFFWISTGALTGQLAATSADATAGAQITLGAVQRVHFFAPTDVGRFIRLGYIAPNWAKAHAYSVGDVIKNGSQGVYRCSVAGTSQNVDNAGPIGTGLGIGDGTCTWDFVNAGGVEYGYVRVTGFINYTAVNAIVVQTMAATTATYYWRLGVYSDTSGYPSCAGLHQQRMLMAGCPANPDRVDASKVADYGNFTPGDTDDDPISETLGLPTVDAIYWVVTKRVAYLGTEGSVQKVYGTTGYDSPLTPTSFEVVEQVQRGSQNLAPVRIVNGLAYVHKLGRELFELYYDFTQDLDLATEISARARHLIQTGVIDIAYQQMPYSLIWLATGDGGLAGCTYYREQQVLGWHRHVLGGGGIVESVACIPGATSDQLWMVVRRTINGFVERYVEVMDDFNAFDPSVAQEDLFFGDCYSVYDGPPATVISGLSYLNGETVTVLADGATIDGPAPVVRGGAITLPVAASKVYVGLDYSQLTALTPSPLAVPQPDGSPLGDKTKVARVKLGLYHTGAFAIGPDAAHLDIQPMRDDAQDMDAPAPLFTGPYIAAFDGEYTLEADVMIQPVGPLPLTVLWVVPHIVTEAGS